MEEGRGNICNTVNNKKKEEKEIRTQTTQQAVCRHRKMIAICQPRREASEEPTPADILILDV